MSKENYSSNKEVLLIDPISKSTRIIKRNLLFFSTITIIGVTYGPDSIKVPMTNLPRTHYWVLLVVLFFIIQLAT